MTASSISRRLMLGGIAAAALAGAARAQVTAPAPAPVPARPQPRNQPPAGQPPAGSLTGQPPAAQPGGADQADVARIEQYLNGIRTLRARFVQVSSEGTARGTFYLSRPGKLRLEYDPPIPTLLIANGGMLQHYDTRLGQQSYVSLDSTPAGLLVREQIRLSGDVTVAAVTRSEGGIDVTLVKTRDPREGRITFSFQAQPMQLRSWSMVDSQGRMTRVTFDALQVGIPLDNALFSFVI